jgi:hypothetical protein
MTLSSGGQGHEALFSRGEDALTLVRSYCFALGVVGFKKDCPVGVKGFLNPVGVVDFLNVGPVGVVGRLKDLPVGDMGFTSSSALLPACSNIATRFFTDIDAILFSTRLSGESGSTKENSSNYRRILNVSYLGVSLLD